jgi:deazaflavin-dependent oxidoreductase (nitroreductase family)
MPVPRAVGKLNRVGFNHLTRPILRHLPGFAVVHHRGRTSGREFQTPVMLFRTDGGFVIALAYGPHTDWVKNVHAAGGCTVETRGHSVTCTAPRLYRDPSRRGIRPVERAVLGWLDVDEFLELHRATDGGAAGVRETVGT